MATVFNAPITISPDQGDSDKAAFINENFRNIVDTANSAFSSSTSQWADLPTAPNTVVANGNRSYTLTFNGLDYTNKIQPGTRIRTTRTVAAPTQCTSLNGTNQYWNKTSPTGITFTNTFSAMGWVKLNAYATGVSSTVIGRDSLTTAGSGWEFLLDPNGRVQIYGRNALGAVVGTSNQSIPLGKWVHVAATMTASTNAATIYIDGVSVSVINGSFGGGTTIVQPTADLTVGKRNGSAEYFNGKIAQAAVFSSILTQATIQSYMSQGLSGSESTLISAYSFNNSNTDLNTSSVNNLTAQGSALATNADSPFGVQASGLVNSTLDYGLVQSATYSTNTVLTVQVPEGCTIPTSGGVTLLSYSTDNASFGFTFNDRFQIAVPSDSIEKTLIKTGIINPITTSKIFNSGSGGGYFFYSNIGGRREVTGSSGTLSTTTTPTIFAITLPSGLFNSIIAPMGTIYPITVSAMQYINVASWTTTSLNYYIWTAVAGTAAINFTAIGY